MSVKTKMTVIADKFRALLGITGLMGLDDMATNLDACQAEVNTQSDLLDQAIDAILNKSSGVIEANPVLQNKSILPTETEQTVVPDNGYDGLSSVSVGAISTSYVGSSIPKKSSETYMPCATDLSIKSGQYLSGDQIILGDENLIPENIRKGASIFGVIGGYAGNSIDSGLPTGISAISYGTFSVTTNSDNYTIQHGLNVAPNFCIIVAKGDVAATDFPECIIYYCAIASKINMYEMDLCLNEFGIRGSSSGGIDTFMMSYSDMGNFSDNEVYVSTDAAFKANTDYCWICGLAEF